MTPTSIRYDKNVRKKCRAAVIRVLPNSGLQLSAPEDKGKIKSGFPFEIQIQQSSVTKTWADACGHRGYVLAPIIDTGLPLPSYWLALRLEFVPGPGDHVLYQASILIFYGEATPQPFVRAEWDNATPGGEHAQPHWHVYGSAIDRTAQSYRTLCDGESISNASSRIHYAMSATWRSDGSSPEAHWKALDNVDALANWITGCLQYLVTQLKYFESKKSAAPAKPKRFTPR